VRARILIPALLCAGSLAATGCITMDQFSALQKDVSDLSARIEEVQAAQKEQEQETQKLRADLDGDASGEQERRADMALRLGTLEDRIRVLGEKTDDSARRAEALASELASLRAALSSRSAAAIQPQAGGAEAPGGRPGAAGAQELFNAAYADYSKGNYPLAVKGFEEFLRRFGDTDLADNARYWIGACYYDSGDYERAIQEFDRVLAEYPNGDKVPGAHLKKGLAYMSMNRTAQGVVQLQYLVENFGATDEARVARERLKGMGLRKN